MTAQPSSDSTFTPWLTLVHAGGLHAGIVDALREELGSIEAISGASASLLTRHGLGDAAVRRLQSPDQTQLDRDHEWLRREGRGLLTIDDPRYPALLREISDPPCALFYVGNIDILQLPALAIVGSRNPTASGRDTAVAFARHLAGVGFCIVSGMASGIDGAAHQGALAAPGHTIAVCGTGLDRIYPPAHRDLAIDIAANGLLLSEYPTGTPPRKFHFPQRNRIISGLSVGTLVVEAARQSGSLITAQQAIEQGREVFAVPGSIHNPLARGCHQLLREGAKLVESAQDILGELGAMVAAHGSADETQRDVAIEHHDDEDYVTLLNALDFDPVSIDTLIIRTGLTPEAVSSMLLILELQGRAVAVSGGRFVRCGEEKKDP